MEKLKQFLFEEKVRFIPEQLDSIDLGPLNGLRFSWSGRQPDSTEWKLLDEKLSGLASYLDEDLRRKIRVRELGIYFGRIPLFFLFAAVFTTLLYPLSGYLFDRGTFSFSLWYLVVVIGWTISQGGLGACAFLLTQVAIRKTEIAGADSSSQSGLIESALDVTDRNLLRIRILLGSLFSFLIGLPVAYRAVNVVYNSLFEEKFDLSASDLSLILVPFLLGFSTNLVLAILNRCVVSVQTFFGISTTSR